MKRFLLSLLILLIIASPASANFFPDIIVTSANGIWTDTRAFATVNAAVTAVGAVNKRTIVIPSAQVVTALTVTANITLRFERDGAIANSGQLTIQTLDIEADDHQIFIGAGDIDFAVGTVVRSTWFSDIDEALDVTSDDTLTMVIAQTETTTANLAVGNNVTLRWESPFILTVNAGDVLSNVRNIEAGNYQILAGAGDVDFLDGSELNLDWFLNLRAVLTWVETEEVKIIVLGTHIVAFTDTAAANEKIDVSNGVFSISIGITLTVQSPDHLIFTPRQQIATGAGTLNFTTASIVHPEWWGVDGTADDVQINEAIDVITTGIVSLEADKTYNTTATITGKSGVTIQGGGRGSTIISAVGDIATITLTGTVSGAQAITVEAAAGQMDVTVTDGSGFAAGNDVVIGRTTHSTFENYTEFVEINTVLSVAGNVLTMKAPLYDTYVITVNFVYLAALVEDFVVDGIGFVQASVASPKRFINAAYTKNCTVKNSDFNTGYRLSFNVSDNLTVENNTFETMALSVDIKRSKYSVVINNSFVDVEYPISVNYNADETRIAGNTLRKSTNGITVNNLSRGCIVDNNTILYAETRGIVFDWNSWNSTITNNEIAHVQNGTSIIYVGNWGTIANNIVRNQIAGNAIRIEDGQYNTVSGNKVKDVGTLASHHGIIVSEGTNTLRACTFNSIIGNIIDNVSGESIYIGATVEANDTVSNVVTGNIVDNAVRAIYSHVPTSSGNTIKGNIVGSASTGTIILSAPDITGDLTLVSVEIDLSGAATAEYLFTAVKRYSIGSIRIKFTEASSANAGVALYVGRRTDTDRFLKIEAASATVESIAIGTVVSFVNGAATAEGVLNSGHLAVGEEIIVTNAGGKVGGGQIQIYIELFEVGI